MSPDATIFDDVLLSLDKVAALIVLEAVEHYRDTRNIDVARAHLRRERQHCVSPQHREELDTHIIDVLLTRCLEALE